MKSEKAKEIIEKYAVGNSRDAAPRMMKHWVIECVELAEQEAEERMRKELTRWHDPKEELPPAEKIVLVKSTYGCGYALAERDDEGWWLAPPEEWELPADRVIGWREIYE